MGTPGSSGKFLIFGMSVLLAHLMRSAMIDTKRMNPEAGCMTRIDARLEIVTNLFSVGAIAWAVLFKYCEPAASQHRISRSGRSPMRGGNSTCCYSVDEKGVISPNWRGR